MKKIPSVPFDKYNFWLFFGIWQISALMLLTPTIPSWFPVYIPSETDKNITDNLTTWGNESEQKETDELLQGIWFTKVEMPTLGSHYRDTTHHLTPQLKSQHFLETPQITQITFLMTMSDCPGWTVLLDSFQSAWSKENSSTYCSTNYQCC